MPAVPGSEGFSSEYLFAESKFSVRGETGHSRDYIGAGEAPHKGPSFVSNSALFKARSDSASALLLAA